MASRSLGTLTLNLVAETGGFVKGMDKSERRSKKWRKQVEQDAKKAGKAMGVGMAAAAAGLAVLYTNAARSADQLAKMSDRVGEAPERLASLQHAAELTGAGAETMNSSLARMVKRLGEAANGTGSAINTIEDLGLATDAFFMMSPADQFAKISDKISALNTQQEKAAAAAAIFGREGLALVNTMALGSEGLAAMEVEAEQLGLTMSRIDLAKIESANDSFERAKVVSQGFGRSLAVEVAPILDAVATLFVDSAKEAGGFGQVTRDVVKSASRGLGVMADGIHGIKLLYKGLIVVVSEVVNSETQLYAKLDKSVTNLLNKIPGVEAEQSKMLQNLSESVGANAEAIREEYQALLLEPIPSEKIKTFIEDAYKKSEEQAKAVAERSSLNIPLSADLSNVDASLGSRKDQKEAAKKLAKEAEEAQKRQQKIQEDYQRLVQDLRTDEEALTDQVRERLAVLEAVSTISDQQRNETLSRIAGDAFSDAPEMASTTDQEGIDESRAELEAWYADQLLMLDKFRSERADLSATWDEQELALKQEHEESLTELSQANELLRRQQMIDGYMSILDVASSYFEGMEGKEAGYARAALTLGSALLDEKKRESLKSIVMSTHTAAMGAYQSLASIPFVGPVLGAVAAGGIYAAGASATASVMGMAHDGIDSIPEDGTWLLQKGERVTTANTSAKLDTTLNNIQRDMQGMGRASGSNMTQNIYVDGKPDNATATQMQREAERSQRKTKRRVG